MTTTILDAIADPNLFRPFLARTPSDSLASWVNWTHALRCLYGISLPESAYEVVQRCTNRSPERMPPEGFDTALFLTGRRSGKSRMAAVIAGFEGILAGRESRLAKGERGLVACISPTKNQSRIVKDYLRAILETPLLAAELVRETKEGFDLAGGVSVEILAGDWRSIRGYSLLACVVDEACFFGMDEESKVKSDTELIRALKPALATTGGKLVAISSPYAKRGWAYRVWKRDFGNDDGSALVWNCPSRTMNPDLPEAVVKEAMADDPYAARSEYGGEWRDDVGEFVSRGLLESLVVKGRKELLPRESIQYTAFADVSGGRADDAALAIAHRDGRRVIVDFARRWRPPFNPQAVIGSMVEIVKRYGCRTVTGDNYAAEFVASAFRSRDVGYRKADKPKSILYAELLPRLSSLEVELLDDEFLINQLASLERRTRSGGRDVIDHPPGSHDDLANAVAGAVVEAGGRYLVLQAC